ncbi:MAG: hypothetical protein R3C24_13395 [Cyanobacteriota/Melainabacteria group bacterium]
MPTCIDGTNAARLPALRLKRLAVKAALAMQPIAMVMSNREIPNMVDTVRVRAGDSAHHLGRKHVVVEATTGA